MLLYTIKTNNKEDDDSVTDFAKKMTFNYYSNDNHYNKILCEFSKTLKTSVINPNIICINLNRLYAIEFIAGTENVFLKELEFTYYNNNNVTKYIENLISDPRTVWKTTPLNYSKNETEISNQLLTLLRICKVDKDEYIKNPNVLSMKFNK